MRPCAPHSASIHCVYTERANSEKTLRLHVSNDKPHKIVRSILSFVSRMISIQRNIENLFADN